MYFRRLFKKNEKLLKKEILYDFMVLEKYHRTINGEARQISLHSIYDFSGSDMDKYYNEEFYIYLKVDDMKFYINVLQFIDRYNFEKIDELPPNLRHILGNYKSTVKAIDGFIP